MSDDPVSVLKEVKNAIRRPYAWPGGYPKYIVMGDGEALSVKAAHKYFREICRATFGVYRSDSWRAAGVDINWENPDLYCAHTNERIPSAYSEDDVA